MPPFSRSLPAPASPFLTLNHGVAPPQGAAGPLECLQSEGGTHERSPRGAGSGQTHGVGAYHHGRWSMDGKENIRVLLVDDERDFVESTARALGRRGFETQTAGDGTEALRLLEMVGFDAVLLDVKMPGVDGTEVFYEVKRRWPRTAIVMLTGHGTDRHSFELTRGGAAGYLAKPSSIEEIVATLSKAVEEARKDEPEPSDKPPEEPSGLILEPTEPRVLLVDDEAEFLRSMTPALRRRGMEVSTAGNGQEGLDVLAETVVDVVVLDMKMPGLSGMETLKAIKRSWPLVEVIVLTGHPSLETAVEAVKHGAYDFLVKPADVEAVTEKIREAFRKKMGETSEEYKRRMEELLKWRRE